MWDKLKKILQVSNDRAIIIEDGEPRYIVLPVDEYLKMSGANPQVDNSIQTTTTSPSDVSTSPAFNDQNYSTPTPTPTPTAQQAIYEQTVDFSHSLEPDYSEEDSNSISLQDLPID